MSVRDTSMPATARRPSPSSSNSTSSISLSASSTRPSLTQAMNSAAKPFHTHLNRSIMARLPLALPPYTEDPAVYARGIRHMLPVYHAFESAWAKHISVEPQTPATEDFSLPDAVLLSVLVHLQLPQMPRADRLRSDLTDLLGIGLGELESWSMRVSGEENLSNSVWCDDTERVPTTEEEVSDEEVDDDDPDLLAASSILRPSAPEHPELRALVRHIHHVSRAKPHVLIAYAWVFYMALFNGGRWIRAQLSQARETWDLSPTATTEDTNEATEKVEAGLSFWHFDGAHDGEDIKDEFKARMLDVERMLSDQQQEEVINETVYIFQACSRLIGEIDSMMLGCDARSDAGPERDEMAESYMIRSELMRPRSEAPWNYLELLFRYLLPLGLYDLIILFVGWGKRATRHFWPMMRLRWNWYGGEGAAVAKNK